MKKVYINPETECIKLDAEALMQGVNNSVGDGDPLVNEYHEVIDDDSEQ